VPVDRPRPFFEMSHHYTLPTHPAAGSALRRFVPRRCLLAAVPAMLSGQLLSPLRAAALTPGNRSLSVWRPVTKGARC
jgi:hypothetical protein